MKKQILKVTPGQTAKVFALLYFFTSLPFVAIMVLVGMVASEPGKGPPPFFLVAMPVLYLVVGYLFTLYGAWVYNLVAARTGGIEFEVSEPGEGR